MLRLGDKLAVLADHVKRVSKRLFDMPDFFYVGGDRGLRDHSALGHIVIRLGNWDSVDWG